MENLISSLRHMAQMLGDLIPLLGSIEESEDLLSDGASLEVALTNAIDAAASLLVALERYGIQPAHWRTKEALERVAFDVKTMHRQLTSLRKVPSEVILGSTTARVKEWVQATLALGTVSLREIATRCERMARQRMPIVGAGEALAMIQQAI